MYFPQKWLDHLLLMTITELVSKCARAREKRKATENVRC